MTTYAALQAEPWWGREIRTDELRWLGDELSRRTGRPRTAAGDKGDNRHLGGSHRSQEWILYSQFATSRTYTVQSGLTVEQLRHIAGFDFVPGEWGSARNRKLMAEQTARVIAAMKAGRLDGLREFYGTVDGRTVTGWDNVRNRTVTSDLSHLDHWHAGFDRRRMTDQKLMERVVAIALGDEEDDMPYRDWPEADRKALAADIAGAVESKGTRYPGSSKKNIQLGTGIAWSMYRTGLISQGVEGLTEEAAASKQREMAILEAISGADTAAIMAKLEAQHAERVATLDEFRTQVLARLDQLEQSHGEIVALVEQGQSGEIEAAEVVRLLGEKLATVAAVPADGS